METTTPFDLNRAIQHFREYLGKSPAFRDENLDELESHLRDSIATLQTRGLSAEEAFMVATKRIGRGGLLEMEFAKVNGREVWFDRLVWIVIGLQCWMLVSTAFMMAYSVTTYADMTVNKLLLNSGVLNSSSEFISRIGHILPAPLLLAVATIVAWRLSRTTKARTVLFFERLARRPAALAVSFLTTSIVLTAVFSCANRYLVAPLLFGNSMSYGSPVWQEVSLHLPQLVACSALTLFVARKRLRLSQA